jgi:hypothetical protein
MVSPVQKNGGDVSIEGSFQSRTISKGLEVVIDDVTR